MSLTSCETRDSAGTTAADIAHTDIILLVLLHFFAISVTDVPHTLRNVIQRARECACAPPESTPPRLTYGQSGKHCYYADLALFLASDWRTSKIRPMETRGEFLTLIYYLTLIAHQLRAKTRWQPAGPAAAAQP